MEQGGSGPSIPSSSTGLTDELKEEMKKHTFS